MSTTPTRSPHIPTKPEKTITENKYIFLSEHIALDPGVVELIQVSVRLSI